VARNRIFSESIFRERRVSSCQMRREHTIHKNN